MIVQNIWKALEEQLQIEFIESFWQVIDQVIFFEILFRF